MSGLHGKLDDVYDPTDANKAGDVAHQALQLMRYALLAVYAHEDGLRIGRDISMELSAHVMRLAESMGLISYGAAAKEFEEFGKDLTGYPSKRANG